MVKPITECKVKLFRVWRLPSHSTRQKVHDVYFSEQKRKFIVHGQRKRPFLTRITIWRTYSRLRNRGSEVVGERENGRARRRLKNWEKSVFKKLDFVPVFIVTRVICLQITLSHVIPLSEQNVIDNLHE